MKTAITKLGDVLTMELQSLYAGELSLQGKIEAINSETDSTELKEILQNYAESAVLKRLKLDRMFSYLMVEPASQVNTVIVKLLDEITYRAKYILSGEIKTRVLISDFQQINRFKITAYKTALMYALELELDTVADLLCQIIEWERKTDKILTELYLKEFNKSTESKPIVYIS